MLINVRHDNAKEWKILIPLLQINSELQGQAQRWTASSAQLCHVWRTGCTPCPGQETINHPVSLTPKSYRAAPREQLMGMWWVPDAAFHKGGEEQWHPSMPTAIPPHLSKAPPRKLGTLNYKQVALLVLLQHGAHRTLNKGVRDGKQTLPASKKLHNSAAATSSLSPHLCDKFCIPQAFVKDLILHGAGCPLYL